MGVYRQTGQVHGGAIYRHVGNLNMWLARFVPLSSFTKVMRFLKECLCITLIIKLCLQAAWLVSDDIINEPGRNSPHGLYFGGNVKCPEAAWKTYIDTPDTENRKRTDIDGIRITCYTGNIHHEPSQLWGIPGSAFSTIPLLPFLPRGPRTSDIRYFWAGSEVKPPKLMNTPGYTYLSVKRDQIT